MNIRLIEESDNQQVKQLIQTALESVGFAIPGTAYFDPFLGELFQYYQKEPFGHYWVIEDAGEIVGGIGIASFKDKEVCELQKLYIRSDYQGLGLSKVLMETALEYASNFYRYCYLETHTDLKAARSLYEKYGFEKLAAPLAETEHSAMNGWYLKKM